MKVSGAVCEFNPFHNGHKYFLSEIKKESDCVVCIMSGNYVQRGDVAVCDKYIRAKSAVKNGADIVIELPVAYSLGAGETFARGAVGILGKTKSIDTLFFGAENPFDEIMDFYQITKTDEFQNSLASYISKGLSYPDAFSSAAQNELIKGSNNILALEYIRQCEKNNITPKGILRKCVTHNSFEHTDCFASGTYIRSLIKNEENYENFVSESIDKNEINSLSKWDKVILAQLRRMTVNDFETIADVTEGLEHRIKRCCEQAENLDDLFEKLKTPRYTNAKFRRIVLCAFLGVTKQMQTRLPDSFSVLACNETGMKWLSNVSKTTDIVPIIRYSDKDKLSKFDKELFEHSEMCDSLYGLMLEKVRNANYNKTRMFKIIDA